MESHSKLCETEEAFHPLCKLRRLSILYAKGCFTYFMQTEKVLSFVQTVIYLLLHVKTIFMCFSDKKKNGNLKSSSMGNNGSVTATPPVERKSSKLAAIGKIFKPWKWKRKKKSEKIEKTAAGKWEKLMLNQVTFDFCLIWFFMSHQQSFSYTGMGLPWLYQY